MDSEYGGNPMRAMAMCPMAPMCQRMLKRSGIGVLIAIPGVLLVSAGVLVILEPRVLFWLLGGASVVIGLGLISAAVLVRKATARFSGAQA